MGLSLVQENDAGATTGLTQFPEVMLFTHQGDKYKSTNDKRTSPRGNHHSMSGPVEIGLEGSKVDQVCVCVCVCVRKKTYSGGSFTARQ